MIPCSLDFRHSDILVRKVNYIGQADLLDGRFARLASKSANLAYRSKHTYLYKLLEVFFFQKNIKFAIYIMCH